MRWCYIFIYYFVFFFFLLLCSTSSFIIHLAFLFSGHLSSFVATTDKRKETTQKINRKIHKQRNNFRKRVRVRALGVCINCIQSAACKWIYHIFCMRIVKKFIQINLNHQINLEASSQRNERVKKKKYKVTNRKLEEKEK